MAGDRGFEPRHTDPESAVLPLDEPPAMKRRHFTTFGKPRQIERRSGSTKKLLAV